MNLSHFTAAETLTPYSVKQHDKPTMKPSGLWVSVDGEDDWPTWCRDNMWLDEESERFTYRYQVTARDGLLVLSTVEQVLAFNDEYGSGEFGMCMVEWARVAANYPGIIIAPYQWDLRMDRRTFWYYTWDCASGCIWDAAAIDSVHPVVGEVAS